MPLYVKIMPKNSHQPGPPAECPLTGPLVAVLVYDGLCTFEFGIASEIFGLPRPEFGADWYRFASCAVEPGEMRAQGGLQVVADRGLELIDSADIIVVPGWKGAGEPVPEALKEALRRAYARGARLVSICSGAFVLAATGLLDGGCATTHWRYADRLRELHPGISVDETSLYRQEDRILTSAGSAAGIDLLLEIVRQDYGPDRANAVARRLVVAAHRNGGQAQFLERPVSRRSSGEIAPLLDLVRQRLADPWTVADMASTCRMSSRTFQRRFVQATGETPGEWLVRERVEVARSLLCSGRETIETVAVSAGFGSAHALRHHFRMQFGLSPTEYRNRFLSNASRQRAGSEVFQPLEEPSRTQA
jgi:AraC family transcriptional activator FtrA